MERLTQRYDAHVAVVCENCHKHSHCTAEECNEVLRERIAAYEETGLEPEEIKELCTDDVAEAAKMFRKMIESGEINHLQDLLQAEKDGRLVVKPFKPGTRFILCDDPNRDITFTGNALFEVKSQDGETEWWGTEELAELKRLRRAGDPEEAEAALAQKGDTHETDPV